MFTPLGPWCSDRLWDFILYEKVKNKLTVRQQKLQLKEDLDKVDEEIKALTEAQKIVASKKSDNAPDLNTDITHKVQIFLHLLREQFESSPSHRCIVFVEKRHTARALAMLLSATDFVLTVKAESLIGQTSIYIDDSGSTILQQMKTVAKFRMGEINCLVATSVAEEGLDIPDCNRIIRFDLYKTMIQYVQSKGRARHHLSEVFTVSIAKFMALTDMYSMSTW